MKEHVVRAVKFQDKGSSCYLASPFPTAGVTHCSPYLVHRVAVSFCEIKDVIEVLLNDKAGSITYTSRTHEA